MEGTAERTAAWWARTPEARRHEHRTNWLEHPRLLHYAARRTTRVPWGEYWRWAMKGAHPRPVDRVLSLGCGGGGLERRILGSGWARHITALDVSPGALDAARTAAEAAGVGDRVRYQVADLNTIELEPGAYDVVVAQQSLHHVAALEHVTDQAARALRPGGILVINEYVGPSRFQLPEPQLEAINQALVEVPERYRIRSSDGSVKRRQPQFDLAWFDANDPSEAVRSGEILEVLGRRFSFPTVKPYGGALLQFLLDDIVGSFTGPGGWRWLGRLAAREVALERQGLIGSDFVVAVGRPRG